LNNDTTAELIRRGILNAPNNPRESFPPNAGWDKTYKLVQNPACPPEPETKVEYGNWVVGEYGCDDTQVTETRTVTTTTYTLVNNVWVGTAVVTQDTPRTRDLMVEELDALFCPGPQPDDKVLVSEWTDGKYECDDTIVEQTRTVTTTPYVLDGETWVEGESKVVTETQTRDLTAEELAELVCPTPTPIPTPSDPPLASTGGSDTSGILVVGLALLGVGFLITAFRVARKLARV
ncbi:MAG: LPXTG cell wall anchor domain-containing protein, partial [Cetobacterium sp.]